MRVQHALCKGLQGILIVLLATCSLHAAAADSHYRWLDNRGNTVLSDRPPPAGIDYEVISSRSGLKRVVQGDQGAVPREVTPTVGNDFTPVPRGEDTASLRNPEICNIARKNLETLNTSNRVQIRDNQGDLKYLSDEEREVQRNEAEALIRQYCD